MTAMPAICDHVTWQTQIDALRTREKAHTREGDAIAAARRRLPMAQIDSATQLIGPNGAVTLLDAFEWTSDRPVVPTRGRTLRRPVAEMRREN